MKSNYSKLSEVTKNKIKELLALNELSKFNILDDYILIANDIEPYEASNYYNYSIILVDEKLDEDENKTIFELLDNSLIIHGLKYDNNIDISKDTSRLIFKVIIENEDKELTSVKFKTNFKYFKELNDHNKYIIKSLYQILALNSLHTTQITGNFCFNKGGFSSIDEVKGFCETLKYNIVISNTELNEEILHEFAEYGIFVVHCIDDTKLGYFVDDNIKSNTFAFNASNKIIITLAYILMTETERQG